MAIRPHELSDCIQEQNDEDNYLLVPIDLPYIESEDRKMQVSDVNKDMVTLINIMNNLTSLLIYKNYMYGNSALNPVNIYSQEPADKQLFIRLDDKLKRIKNSSEKRKNDFADNIGYIVLLMMYYGWIEFDEFMD